MQSLEFGFIWKTLYINLIPNESLNFKEFEKVSKSM